MNSFVMIIFGVVVGFFAGLLGIGGGAVIIPILVLAFHIDQQTAHGTSLAMILSPTALPAIWKYHSAGKIDWSLVLWVIPGMLGGSYLGAWLANSISTTQLKLIFGFMLIYTAGYTIFSKDSAGRDNPMRGVIVAAVVLSLAVALWYGMRWYDAARSAANAAA